MATCVLYLFATVNSFLDRCSENEAVETTRSSRFALLPSCLAVFASGKHEFDRLWDRSGMSVWVMVCLPDLNCAQFTLSSFKALNKLDSFSLADRQNTSSLGYLIFVKLKENGVVDKVSRNWIILSLQSRSSIQNNRSPAERQINYF